MFFFSPAALLLFDFCYISIQVQHNVKVVPERNGTETPPGFNKTHAAVFLPEGTCNKKKVGLNLIFGGTLVTSSVLKCSRETNKENTTLYLPLRLSSYFRT